MNKVDKSVIDDGRAVLLVAFGMLLGVVVAYIWPWKTSIVGQTKDWVDIATAIGTLGAVVAAVGIALRDARWRRQAQTAEALIAWGIVANEVVRLLDELRVVRRMLGSGGRMTLGYDLLSPLHEAATRLVPGFGADVLFKLAHLPDGVGGHLSGAIGLLPGIRLQIDRVLDRRIGMGRTVSRDYAIRWTEQATRNLEYVLSWSETR